MRVVLITGISGSGKSIALNVLEDDGFYCIDNLPVRFLQDVVLAQHAAGLERLAVSVDVRSGSLADVRQTVAALGRMGHDVRTLFLNARTDTLVQRYSETRRRHPLSDRGSSAAPGDLLPTLVESIERERELMAEIEEVGAAIDTSDLHPNVLRQWIRSLAGIDRSGLTLMFESFAYKYGVPLDADLVFDARCLPNPYYDHELRPLTGLDAPVARFLEQIPAARRLIDHIDGFVRTWLPSYVQENRSYLTVAIGCTGGQHRSVYCVEQLAARFTGHDGTPLVRHRALESRIVRGTRR